ncbi:MAG: nucleotidyltransferase domain-containing protein, partial [Nanoarchaeota archaeon]|nr:nucleotidyltransferase domain-containing protein [Nanoarchaeota archaeon]
KHSFLRKIVEKIQKDKKIKLAILFGSYVKGLEKKDSDIDIYIETNNKKVKQDLELIDSKINVKIGKYDKENLLIKEIEKDHVIIKGVEEFYERNNFFD